MLRILLSTFVSYYIRSSCVMAILSVSVLPLPFSLYISIWYTVVLDMIIIVQSRIILWRDALYIILFDFIWFICRVHWWDVILYCCMTLCYIYIDRCSSFMVCVITCWTCHFLHPVHYFNLIWFWCPSLFLEKNNI